MSTLKGSASALGPALGGLIVLASGCPILFLLLAAMFALTAVVVFRISDRTRAPNR
ncbi:MAG: hypothetical protein ACK4GG_00505 [Sphingomonas sp.]